MLHRRLLGACALFAIAAGSPAASLALSVGDVVVAAPNAGLIAVNPRTGSQTLLVAGGPDTGGPTGPLAYPRDVAVDERGVLYATTNHGVVRFDPSDADGPRTIAEMGFPSGIEWDGAGNLLVPSDIGPPTYDWGLFRVGVDGAKRLLSSGQHFNVVENALPAAGGGWWVGDYGEGVLRVDADGAQSQFARVDGLWDLVLDGDRFYASGYEDVYVVDVATGEARVLATEGPLVRPGALALAGDGGLYVSDLAGTRGIVRIELATGAQTLIASGGLLAQGASGMALVTAVPEPLALAQLALGLGAIGWRRRSVRGIDAPGHARRRQRV